MLTVTFDDVCDDVCDGVCNDVCVCVMILVNMTIFWKSINIFPTYVYKLDRCYVAWHVGALIHVTKHVNNRSYLSS